VKRATTPNSRVSGSPRLGVVALVLTFAWLTLAAYVVHTRMPTTAVSLPGEAALKPMMNLFMPEGWAFFTKSPRDERLLPFVRTSNGSWIYANRGPNAEARNLFGISRSSRAQGPEMGLLISKVPVSAWRNCAGDAKPCLDSSPVAFAGQSPSATPVLCGTVGLVLQEPLPWAWFAARDRVNLPSRVARLEIRC